MVIGSEWMLPAFALLALGCCWFALIYARWRQLYDQPGERRSHVVATPRGGGVGIVMAMLVALVCMALWLPERAGSIGGMAFALVMVAGIGWLDDHHPLSAWVRLAVHGVAGVVLACVFWESSPWVAVLALLLVPTMVNLWNFMDGINGLVTTQVGLAALGIGLMIPAPWQVIAWCVAVSCLVFLPFNFPRARIFLGDVGSGALGLLLSILVLLTLSSAESLGHASLVVLPLLPMLVDASFTLMLRLWRGDNVMQPHREHLYQWAVRSGFRHASVTLSYFLVTATLVALALGTRSRDEATALSATVVATVLCALVWVCGRTLLARGARKT